MLKSAFIGYGYHMYAVIYSDIGLPFDRKQQIYSRLSWIPYAEVVLRMARRKQAGRHRQKWDGFSEDLFLPAQQCRSVESPKAMQSQKMSPPAVPMANRCLVKTSFVDQLVQQQRNGHLISKKNVFAKTPPCLCTSSGDS